MRRWSWVTISFVLSVRGRPSTSSAAASRSGIGAGRIAAQILDHARPDQLDRDGDLLDLVLAQQLAHHPPGEHPILAQRAPDLGQVVGAAAAAAAPAASPPSARDALRPRRFVVARGGSAQNSAAPSAPIRRPRTPSRIASHDRNAARGRPSGGGVGAAGGGVGGGGAAGVGCCICGIGG